MVSPLKTLKLWYTLLGKKWSQPNKQSYPFPQKRRTSNEIKVPSLNSGDRTKDLPEEALQPAKFRIFGHGYTF